MPSEETIIVPVDLIYQCCDEGVGRMECIVDAPMRDYLPYALQRPGSYDEACWHARRLLRDYGRITRDHDSRTLQRTVEAMATLQREMYYLISRYHGIHYQTVDVVRFIAHSAVVLRLVPTRIKISPSLSDDPIQDY